MKKTQKFFINLFIIFISIALGVFFCEMAARFILNPGDYLAPTLERDNILGIRLPPKSSGHDEWGFRNKAVITAPEIVTLGDSHTYGNTAKMAESWPAVLARLTGKQVYNLGMGGYGPNQYFYLFKTKALTLRPKVIICGLYMGDDFDNAYEITYGLDYWQYLRDKNIPKLDNWDIWEKDSNLNWHKNLRNWLSRNSMLYRLTVHGIFQNIKGNIQIKHASSLYDSTTSLLIKEKNIQEAFRPKRMLYNLDQNEKRVMEGMNITRKLLRDMNDTCRSRNIEFIVAIIPTKESVFSNYIKLQKNMSLYDIIDKLITNETKARDNLIMFFKNENIQYIDLLAPMRQAVTRERLYAYTAADMHPNKNGYRVIAESIASYLIQSHNNEIHLNP